MSHASAVEALLFAALEKATAAERVAFLDAACAGDAELRRQVERLLQAEARVGDFLQKPVVELFAATPEPAHDPPRTTDHASRTGGAAREWGGVPVQHRGDHPHLPAQARPVRRRLPGPACGASVRPRLRVEGPVRADFARGLHLPNWLEAQVLRLEVEALLRPGPGKGK